MEIWWDLELIPDSQVDVHDLTYPGVMGDISIADGFIKKHQLGGLTF